MKTQIINQDQQPVTPQDQPSALSKNPTATISSGTISPNALPVDFVIVTALEEERDAILNKLPRYQKLTPSDDDVRIYFLSELPITFSDGSSGIYRIVVMPLLGMGRVQASVATIDAIRRWHPRYVILVGIAGGIATKNVNLGDVLVSDQIVDYESQKLTPEGPQVRWEVHRADPRLVGAARNFSNDDWQVLITVKRPGSGVPERHIGPIVSGDKVIAFGEVLTKYRNTWPALIGVEMEAAGVATASFQAAGSPGFFMVRGVSDLADEKKSSGRVKKWRSYACDVAASYAIALLKSGPVSLSSTSEQVSARESWLGESGWEENSSRPRSTPWKPNRLKPPPLSTDSKIGRILNYAPFEYEYAEDDLNFLFGEIGGFWSGHPIYHKIANSNNSEVIFGVDGCGKTALAHALVEIDNPSGSCSNILPLYIPGQLEITEIRQNIAHSLLTFVCASPFKLARLGNTERDLLARQLCMSLGYDIVQASIEGALRQQISGARALEQPKPWEAENVLQLNTFKKFLEKYGSASYTEMSNWLKLTQLAISALEFNFVLVNLDVDASKIDYTQEILSLLRSWVRYNLIIKLFLPQTVRQKLARRVDNLSFLQLIWTDEQLDQMAHWRFDRLTILAGIRLSLESIFDKNLYPEFIRHAQRNPRRLVRLWRYLFEDHINNSPDQRTFSAENLARAVEKLQ